MAANPKEPYKSEIAWETSAGSLWADMCHVQSQESAPKKQISKEGRGRREVLVFLCCRWVLSREQAACPASCRKSAAGLWLHQVPGMPCLLVQPQTSLCSSLLQFRLPSFLQFPYMIFNRRLCPWRRG